MTLNIKSLLIILGVPTIIFLAIAGIFFYKIHKLEEANQQLSGQLDVQHRFLTESLQRAETTFVKQATIDRLAEELGLNLLTIREDLTKIDARLEAVATTVAKTPTIIRVNIPSTSTTPNPSGTPEVPTCPTDDRPIDVHGYTQNVQTLRVTDNNEMPVADVSFTAASPAPWNFTTFGITYRINQAISRVQRDGRILLHT